MITLYTCASSDETQPHFQALMEGIWAGLQSVMDDAEMTNQHCNTSRSWTNIPCTLGGLFEVPDGPATRGPMVWVVKLSSSMRSKLRLGDVAAEMLPATEEAGVLSPGSTETGGARVQRFNAPTSIQALVQILCRIWSWLNAESLRLVISAIISWRSASRASLAVQ